MCGHIRVRVPQAQTHPDPGSGQSIWLVWAEEGEGVTSGAGQVLAGGSPSPVLLGPLSACDGIVPVPGVVCLWTWT